MLLVCMFHVVNRERMLFGKRQNFSCFESLTMRSKSLWNLVSICRMHLWTKKDSNSFPLNQSFIPPIYLHLIFDILCVACKNPVQTWKKNPVHQTWYFKLENVKNQVQIDREIETHYRNSLAQLYLWFIRKNIYFSHGSQWKNCIASACIP